MGFGQSYQAPATGVKGVVPNSKGKAAAEKKTLCQLLRTRCADYSRSITEKCSDAVLRRNVAIADLL